MFNLFKRNKKSLNTFGHCGGNRGVVPERGHAPSSVLPNKQPHVWIEFDNISNPTVWIDGDKVEALDTLDVNWETDRRNRNSFGISYTNSNDACVVSWQDNTQSIRTNIATGKNALFGSIKEVEKVDYYINEAKKDGSIILVLTEELFGTDLNTLAIVLKSLGYRCTTAKLAFEGEQISERLLITIEE